MFTLRLPPALGGGPVRYYLHPSAFARGYISICSRRPAHRPRPVRPHPSSVPVFQSLRGRKRASLGVYQSSTVQPSLATPEMPENTPESLSITQQAVLRGGEQPGAGAGAFIAHSSRRCVAGSPDKHCTKKEI